MTRSYVAIAECPTAAGEAWWISFPSFPGVTSAADAPDAIIAQARDALATAIHFMRDAGQAPPATVEDGTMPDYDLNEYQNPLVLLIPSPEMAQAA